jgi:hypothetical protein
MLGESGHFDNIVVPSRIIGLTGGNPLFAAHCSLFWHRAGVGWRHRKVILENLGLRSSKMLIRYVYYMTCSRL